MDPQQLFVDERLTGFCVYCGSTPDTVDHCPSKVLLDEPFPPDLAVVEACAKCNNSFSMDEQYLACLVESALCGTADPDLVSRQKIKRILADTPALEARLNDHKSLDESGNLLWGVDVERVRRVVLKLARGHIAYELSVPKLDEPDCVNFAPLVLMSDKQRAAFESPGDRVRELWPEIGSRAFIRAAKPLAGPQSDEWIIVQPGRYRYIVAQSGGDLVQMVLSEYLACQVVWH